MTIESRHLEAAAPVFGRRLGAALAVALTDAAIVLFCFRFDGLGVFGGGNGLSCLSLGLGLTGCDVLAGHGATMWVLLPAILTGALMALGVYDPRPLLLRLEQSRRSPLWLAVNAAGCLLIVSPYLLLAAGFPLSTAGGLAPYLVAGGAILAAAGLLLWLSDREQLRGTLKPHQAIAALATVLGYFGIRQLEALGWGIPALQDATFESVVFLLKLIGEPVTTEPGLPVIGVNAFSVEVGPACSGIAGILMVSAVMAGYVLVFRRRLVTGRALLLIPLAALLSWVLNVVRIAALLEIGAYVSPDLAVGGFHGRAGWLSFCLLSALMLVGAENTGWLHRGAASATRPAKPLLSDPVVAQIAPFAVLLVSSLLSSAAFTQPEAGYPLRAALMAGAVLLFWKAYRAQIGPVDAAPVLAGALVAAVWLAVRAGGTPLTVAGILGPVSQSAVLFWVAMRISGTVLLVPFIEEMFFRGYLLRTLDFGGPAGKVAALALTSALFGALHASVWLAAASGLLFGLLALRRGKLFDAVAAHATANAGIAMWAVVTGDWSVI